MPDRPERVASRFARWFPGDRLTEVDALDAMALRFDRLPHQRPATCGAYVLSYLLPAIGFERHDGHDLADEDYLAHLAAVVVESDEVGPSDAISRQVAAGELSEADAIARHASAWYRFPVRSSSDPIESGTSPSGVARAIALGSEGALVSLPLAARRADGDIQLTESVWDAILGSLAERTDRWRWHAICNYETDRLLRPDDPAFRPALLGRTDSAALIPRDDWGVGHFVGVAGLWRPRGTDPWWLLLFDTYKERGFEGYEPQPATLLRDGLVRDDGREGGILLVLPREVLDEAASMLRELAIDIRMWSNGSPPPDDWEWSLGR